MKTNVMVYNEECLNVVVNSPAVDRVYYDMSVTDFNRLPDVVNYCHECGKEIFLAMPYIFRDKALTEYIDNMDILKGAKLDGYLVRNLEELGFLKENGVDNTMVADYNLYAFNDFAIETLATLGISEYTISPELNRGEIGELKGCIGSEMIVYGYMPAMISAQCVTKNIKGCVINTDSMNSVMYLRDRKNKLLPVYNNCRYCMNIIYNSSVLNLTDRINELIQLGINSIRLDTALLDVKQVSAVLAGSYDTAIDAEYTKGHFLRGVE